MSPSILLSRYFGCAYKANKLAKIYANPVTRYGILDNEIARNTTNFALLFSALPSP